jgi:hypothetical protein
MTLKPESMRVPEKRWGGFRIDAGRLIEAVAAYSISVGDYQPVA